MRVGIERGLPSPVRGVLTNQHPTVMVTTGACAQLPTRAPRTSIVVVAIPMAPRESSAEKVIVCAPSDGAAVVETPRPNSPSTLPMMI